MHVTIKILRMSIACNAEGLLGEVSKFATESYEKSMYALGENCAPKRKACSYKLFASAFM